jgi:hypothetical protein
VNLAADLTQAWRGLGLTVAGKREAAACFAPTIAGFFVALGWLVLALLLVAAAQSAAVGLPDPMQLVAGFGIQGVTVAALAIATSSSIRFLRLEVRPLQLLVPIVWFMALMQVLAIPLVLLGPNVQVIAVLILALLIWRAGLVLGAMRTGVALAFALLCLMVLVVVPNALYMLLLVIPSPA